MFNHIAPVTRNIIGVNIILFIISEYFFPELKFLLSAYLPSSPNFHSWQVITHMFMHGSLMHLVFNMFTLFSFGNILELTLGQRQYLILYFLSGIGAFVLFNFWNYYQVYQISQVLIEEGADIREIYLNSDFSNFKLMNSSEAALALQQHLSGPILGASGAVFGIVAGFSTLFPNSEIFMMFIPFPIKAKYLFPIVVFISLFLGIRQLDGDNIAHFAHVGGALVGWIMMKNWKNNRNRIT